MTQEDATFCAARWRALCGRLGAGEQASAAWWARVSAAYSGDGRFYHTLRHIGQMLQLKDAHAASLADGDAVELAIFFHDVVYDAAGGGGGKNERDSALVLLEFCESALGGGYAAAQRVARWIEMTAHHRCDAETEADCRFFMDFDMAILAAPPAEYSAYSRAVRREYGHVSTVAWCVGRGRFLSQAAAAGTAVFATPAFAALEERARSNASVVGLALLLPASPSRTFARAATAAAAAVAAAAAATRFEPFPQRDGAARDARPACIAGSFNPPHNGHLGLVRHLSLRHSAVVVVIGHNAAKAYAVSPLERQALVRQACAELQIENVRVECSDDYIWRVARKHGAPLLYRGIRSWAKDGLAERWLEFLNLIGPPALALAPPLRTCFLEADPRYAHVSSTLIRRRCAAAESVADLVPPSIADAVAKLYG